ncbi:hypothetical protein BH23CHL2_BH23CHL2_32590 [soil metagenome]
MVTRQISVIDIQQRDDFDGLLRELHRFPASTITVDVAADIDVLNEPAEFEELLAVARLHEIELELATDDPVRQELARIYGMRVASDPSTRPTAILRANSLATTRVMPLVDQFTEQHCAVDTSEESIDETTPFHVARSEASPFDTDASFSFVIAPPDSRPRPRTRTLPSERPSGARSRPVSPALGSSAIFVAGVVIVAAIAVLLTSLLAPSADVIIVPETTTLTTEVTYGVAGYGESLDVAIEPTVLSTTLTYESTVPASGERMIPDEAARGMVFLTNPFSEIVALPEGTTFTTMDGEISFISLEPIAIPAADPFESARFGTAAVGIEAVQPGSASNLDVGGLSGVHESGILFQNRFPIGGGSERAVSVVTSEDLESLRLAAHDALQAQAVDALNVEMEPGWMLIDGSRVQSEIVADFSAEIGEVADVLSVVAEMSVTGESYDPAALEADARDYLFREIASKVPSGFGLVIDSIRLSAPQAMDGIGDLAFRISAEGIAEAQFDPDFADRLSDELVGRGEGQANRLLSTAEGVGSYTVSYGPSWLPWEPIPRLTNRISVDIRGS